MSDDDTRARGVVLADSGREEVRGRRQPCRVRERLAACVLIAHGDLETQIAGGVLQQRDLRPARASEVPARRHARPDDTYRAHLPGDGGGVPARRKGWLRLVNFAAGLFRACGSSGRTRAREDDDREEERSDHPPTTRYDPHNAAFRMRRASGRSADRSRGYALDPPGLGPWLGV